MFDIILQSSSCISLTQLLHSPANCNQDNIVLLRDYCGAKGGVFLSNPFQKLDHILQPDSTGQLVLVKASTIYGGDSLKKNHQRYIHVQYPQLASSCQNVYFHSDLLPYFGKQLSKLIVESRQVSLLTFNAFL